MKQLRLDQAVRNLTCGDLEILIVVTGLGETGLKRQGSCTSWICLGKGGGVQMVRFRASLIGLTLVRLMSFSRMVSIVLVLRRVGTGYLIQRQNYVSCFGKAKYHQGCTAIISY